LAELQEQIYYNHVRVIDDLRRRLNAGWSSIQQTIIDQNQPIDQ